MYITCNYSLITAVTSFVLSLTKLKSDCPRLSSVVSISTEVLTCKDFAPSLLDDNKEISCLMEGLFAHYFSADRPVYNSEDVRWFLELANKQEKWKINVCVGHRIGTCLHIACNSAVSLVHINY